MDFEFTQEQILLRDSVRKMMDKRAPATVVRRLDGAEAYPYELYNTWVDMGLLRLPFPEEYGGLGGSIIDLAIVCEELARSCYGFYAVYSISVLNGLAILREGSEEQKRYWIPKLLSGEIRMSVSISEPDTGSDVGSLRATGRRDGNYWIISGQKSWGTGAGAKNNVINVYVRTNADANYRNGMSLFLVENETQGVQLRRLEMLGLRCAGNYEVYFYEVRVPADRLIGGEGKGWDCILRGLQLERVAAAAGYCGGAQAVVDIALAYAKERKQFGRPIGTFQALGHMLADMQTEVDAARMLMWRAAWSLESGRDALRDISVAKLFCSETYAKVANMGMQIFGAYGYSMEFDMQRHFRDSRSATIGVGTSQMQRNTIAGSMGLKIQ